MFGEDEGFLFPLCENTPEDKTYQGTVLWYVFKKNKNILNKKKGFKTCTGGPPPGMFCPLVCFRIKKKEGPYLPQTFTIITPVIARIPPTNDKKKGISPNHIQAINMANTGDK